MDINVYMRTTDSPESRAEHSFESSLRIELANRFARRFQALEAGDKMCVGIVLVELPAETTARTTRTAKKMGHTT